MPYNCQCKLELKKPYNFHLRVNLVTNDTNCSKLDQSELEKPRVKHCYVTKKRPGYQERSNSSDLKRILSTSENSFQKAEFLLESLNAVISHKILSSGDKNYIALAYFFTIHFKYYYHGDGSISCSHLMT